jgi:hypothetical protein
VVVVVLEQRPARSPLAAGGLVAQTASEAFEVASLFVQVGNRAVLDDTKSISQTLEKVPAPHQSIERARVEMTERVQALELHLDPIDFE